MLEYVGRILNANVSYEISQVLPVPLSSLKSRIGLI